MSDLKRRVQVSRLEFKNERTPYSPLFKDVYFSPQSGIDESKYIYLEGSGALDSIRSGKERITIAEIGFGVGLNFLLTLQEFQNTPSHQTLHYFSFENHPIKKSDLENLYSMYPSLKELASKLLQEYPVLTPGVHLIRLLDGRVNLYLALGDANELLSRLDFHADHWYWDGFAPSRNPDAFSSPLFLEVVNHSNPLAKGASFTAAGWVRRALEDHKFEVKKRPGFGNKRECIEATFLGERTEIPADPWLSRKNQKPLAGVMEVAVIGAGLGGSAIARALAERNINVTVIDPHGIAGRASSNPIGLFNTQLSKLPNPVSRFSQLALTHLIRELGRLKVPSSTGILRTDLHDPAPLIHSEYPEDFYEVQERGLFFPTCGMVDPRKLCEIRLNHPNINFIQDSVTRVERTGTGLGLYLKGAARSFRYDHVVYSLGADAKLEGATDFKDPLHDLNPTRPIRGQILLTTPTEESRDLAFALVEEGYATPVLDGIQLIGATYQAKNIAPDQEAIDTRHLLEESKKWPEFKNLSQNNVQSTKIGFRLSTPDKLPMIGPLCDPDFLRRNYEKLAKGSKSREGPSLESPPGEWLLTGLGSRGITYSSFSAEILACWMTGEPIPLELDLLEHLHSVRFFIRNLRKPGIR